MGRRLIHKEGVRSTILVAIAAALATIALVVVSSGNNSALAATSLVNGNFEAGNLTGWSDDTTSSGGKAGVVTSYAHTVYCEDWSCLPPPTTSPQEGSYFALLTSGYQQSQATRISQPFEASNGDKVNGWAFFKTDDNVYMNACTGANADKAQVVIKSDSGTTIATPFEQSVSSVGYSNEVPRGYSGWRYWEYTFSGLTGTGKFQVEARVQTNSGAAYTDLSVIGLDDVKTSTGGPDTTPPETYITSGYGHVSPGVACITDSTSNTFEFSSNEQGSTFECQLSKDGAVVQPWADCTSPKSYSNLSRAEQWETLYRFEVRAIDPAGNVNPTSASRYWFVKRGTETQPPPDTTAPKVYSVFPKEDATGVDPTTNITATFTEDMLASSIDGQTFKLFKKGSTTKLAATVSYPDRNSPSYTAKLDPRDSLRSGVTYKAVVSTGAKDLAGNPLAQQKAWFFKVR
jgi:Bacterial Ig-like domain